ncbi:MAG: beta-propeller fold lactonase family protein [Solirubrobacterales bacterium]|nr:beta-propeller fold lactonase family protein [Solirubrobacterales bacterium]
MSSYLRGGVGLLALIAVLAVAGPAFASRSPVLGRVYVNDNTAGSNTISGYDRLADGTLSPIPGSPFFAGGAGTGTSIASQGAIQVSSDGRYVLAVDAGSNQISVLRIRHDGALRLVRDGVADSQGSDPVSIAEHDRLVYVANAGTGGSNYTGFVLTRAGHLLPLPGSTLALPDAAQPGDVLFNSTGTNLVGTRVGTS